MPLLQSSWQFYNSHANSTLHDFELLISKEIIHISAQVPFSWSFINSITVVDLTYTQFHKRTFSIQLISKIHTCNHSLFCIKTIMSSHRLIKPFNSYQILSNFSSVISFIHFMRVQPSKSSFIFLHSIHQRRLTHYDSQKLTHYQNDQMASPLHPIKFRQFPTPTTNQDIHTFNIRAYPSNRLTDFSHR